MVMEKCKICDHELTFSDTFCPECGFEVHILPVSVNKEIQEYEREREDTYRKLMNEHKRKEEVLSGQMTSLQESKEKLERKSKEKQESDQLKIDKLTEELNQCKKDFNQLKKEKDNLTTKKNEIEKELGDYRNKYNAYLEDSKKRILAKQTGIKKLENELKETKSQLAKAQQKITEISEIKPEDPPSKAKQPIAFILVTEFDQTNAYCLYEGKNIFGAMQADANQTDYQMLVVSDNNLNARHFEIDVYRKNKRFVYSVSPNNESCLLALNSQSNFIKTEESIQINDILYIGNVKIQIIDNFNKTI